MDQPQALSRERRWYAFSEHLRKLFPFKVAKIPIDAGFTCPNRDGTVGVGGCAWCDSRSFSPNARGERLPVVEQVRKGIEFHRKRGSRKCIAYFQTGTNTHAPEHILRQTWGEALRFPEIVGLAIGTRPDCVPEPVLAIVEEIARDRRVWLELGVQTRSDEANRRANRCHTFADFEDAVVRARGRGFEIATHVILGLPGDDVEGMRALAVDLARLGVDSVKLHHLYVCPGTPMEAAWRRGEVRVAEFEEHVRNVCDFLERLPWRVSIQRFVGELGGPWVLAPLWGKTKDDVARAIDEELARRGRKQGALASA